jgi:hypothetical protein
MSDHKVPNERLANGPDGPFAKMLDERLAAVFSGIDTRPDFDARLFERLQVEATQDAQERAQQARQLEQLRHGAAKQELLSWRRWTQAVSRVVTLETIGVGVLAVSVITSVWSADQIRQVAPILVTVVGALLALAPVLNVPRLGCPTRQKTRFLRGRPSPGVK